MKKKQEMRTYKIYFINVVEIVKSLPYLTPDKSRRHWLLDQWTSAIESSRHIGFWSGFVGKKMAWLATVMLTLSGLHSIEEIYKNKIHKQKISTNNWTDEWIKILLASLLVREKYVILENSEH